LNTGNFIADAEIPETSLEEETTNVEGAEKIDFLRFLRRILQWRPEDRPTAEELLLDPWVKG
jgi:hypothetical protein